jgi:hypothetical protein
MSDNFSDISSRFSSGLYIFVFVDDACTVHLSSYDLLWLHAVCMMSAWCCYVLLWPMRSLTKCVLLVTFLYSSLLVGTKKTCGSIYFKTRDVNQTPIHDVTEWSRRDQSATTSVWSSAESSCPYTSNLCCARRDRRVRNMSNVRKLQHGAIEGQRVSTVRRSVSGCSMDNYTSVDVCVFVTSCSAILSGFSLFC